MKKLHLLAAIAIMILIMSGCKADHKVSEQEVTPTTLPPTGIPTQAVKEEAEETIQLLPGFEAVEVTDAVKALNKVLTIEAAVKMVATNEAKAGTSDYEQCYLNEMNHFLDINFDEKLRPNQYAVVDMDHDGTPEVIVSLSRAEDSFVMLLRYYEGSMYGYPYELRALENPKKDGTYLASSGAFDNKLLEMSFDGMDIKEKSLAYSKSVDNTVEYYIADKKVTENEYNEFYNKYLNSEDVKWHLFSSDLRAGYTGEELLRVDFNAITTPTGEELESYYTDAKGDIKLSYSSRIPKELSDMIIDAMKSGKEEETFEPLKVGTELSQEQFCGQTGLEIAESEAMIPIQADVDNDKNQDLIGLHYWGGTGGFCSMELYQGSEDGDFRLTNSFDCLYQEYKLLSYQGKNYLLMKDFDYNTKYDSGYTLYLYEDGTLTDGMSFRFDIQDYEMKIPYESTSYEGMDQIKKTLCNKKLVDIFNKNGVIYGTGETIDESDQVDYRYSCDIDNDGKPEYYNKSIWYPSNLGTVMKCIYDFKDSKVFEDLCSRLSDEMGEGRLYTFWIDKINEENVMYLYYGNNLDFTLYAYLLKREE